MLRARGGRDALRGDNMSMLAVGGEEAATCEASRLLGAEVTGLQTTAQCGGQLRAVLRARGRKEAGFERT